MRAVALLVACLVVTPIVASEPGQPLDCSDWLLLEPGMSCTPVLPQDCYTNPWCTRGTDFIIDNDSRAITLRYVTTGVPCPQGGSIGRTELVAEDLLAQSETVLAYVLDRCDLVTHDVTYPSVRCNSEVPCAEDRLFFDEKRGQLFFPLDIDCASCDPSYPQTWLLVIDGFTRLIDLVQTFASRATIGFRVPYTPEGLHGVDRFDTYYGPLTRPIDFTQAQGLVCSYPTATPAVGDYLEVADALPDPAPGTGRYYFTAATYQGQTRYGRKTINSVLSGRDPAVLPGCASGGRANAHKP